MQGVQTVLLALIGGVISIIVGILLIPVLTSSLSAMTEENRFTCRGNVTGTGVYTAYCTLSGTFTKNPAAGRALVISSPPVFTPDSANSPSLSGSGLGFTVATSPTAAAATAAQRGPVAWAPGVGVQVTSLLEILPMLFAVGLVIFGVSLFVGAGIVGYQRYRG